MIQPLINLIDMNACYRIDIQHNLSLSLNSSTIKYMLVYKGFDPTIDYVVTTSEVTFKPTLKWWTHKCASYCNQDESFNSKLLKQMKYLDHVCDKYQSIHSQLLDITQCVHLTTTTSLYQCTTIKTTVTYVVRHSQPPTCNHSISRYSTANSRVRHVICYVRVMMIR